MLSGIWSGYYEYAHGARTPFTLTLTANMDYFDGQLSESANAPTCEVIATIRDHEVTLLKEYKRLYLRDRDDVTQQIDSPIKQVILYRGRLAGDTLQGDWEIYFETSSHCPWRWRLFRQHTLTVAHRSLRVRRPWPHQRGRWQLVRSDAGA